MNGTKYTTAYISGSIARDEGVDEDVGPVGLLEETDAVAANRLLPRGKEERPQKVGVSREDANRREQPLVGQLPDVVVVVVVVIVVVLLSLPSFWGFAPFWRHFFPSKLIWWRWSRTGARQKGGQGDWRGTKAERGAVGRRQKDTRIRRKVFCGTRVSRETETARFVVYRCGNVKTVGIRA